jgi:hypothetical protein
MELTYKPEGGTIMISPLEYFEGKLYPLQDGVLNIIAQSGTDCNRETGEQKVGFYAVFSYIPIPRRGECALVSIL